MGSGLGIVLLGAHAARSGTAAFALAPNRASVTLPGGCDVLVDPQAAVVAPVTTNAVGQANLPIDLPSGVTAGAVYAQLISLDPGAPNGMLALSNGVRIDVH